MQLIFWLGLWIVAMVLQSTVMAGLTQNGIKPDLLIVLISVVGLVWGWRPALGLGALYGLLEDLLVGKFIGLNTAAKLVCGLVAGFSEKGIYKENMWAPVVVVFLASIAHDLVFIGLGALAGLSTTSLAYSFLRVTVVSGLINSLLALFVYGPVHNSSRKGFLRRGIWG